MTYNLHKEHFDIAIYKNFSYTRCSFILTCTTCNEMYNVKCGLCVKGNIVEVFVSEQIHGHQNCSYRNLQRRQNHNYDATRTEHYKLNKFYFSFKEIKQL